MMITNVRPKFSPCFYSCSVPVEECRYTFAVRKGFGLLDGIWYIHFYDNTHIHVDVNLKVKTIIKSSKK